MPAIPSYCNKCKIVYNSGIFIGGGIAELYGNTSTCPVCGSTNRIPDGLYNFIDNTINLVNSPYLTLGSLRRIKKSLVNIQKQNLEVVDIKDKINKEIPELNSLVDTLPRTRIELYEFLLVILAVLTLAISSFKGDQKQPIEYNTFINNYYQVDKPVQVPDTATIKTKIQRNDPCHCGSGKKFKNCHGKH